MAFTQTQAPLPRKPLTHTEPEPVWVRAERRRRHLWVPAIAVVAVLLAAAVLLLARNAAAHYERGRQAMSARQYYTATKEFEAARLVLFPYRDAELQEATARRFIEIQDWEADERARVANAVRELVALATTRLGKADTRGVAMALADARALVPKGALVNDSATLTELSDLAVGLGKTCRRSLADSKWAAAAACSSALLAIDPNDKDGRLLAKRARLGVALERKLDRAQTAAQRREWRHALRLATAVTAAWPRFPGAAALTEKARKALAPKPKPQQTPTPQASTPATSPRPTVPYIPPPPPP